MEEEDFPRGGASALSPLEVRKIKEKAEKDVLFGVSDVHMLHFVHCVLCKGII